MGQFEILYLGLVLAALFSFAVVWPITRSGGSFPISPFLIAGRLIPSLGCDQETRLLGMAWPTLTTPDSIRRRRTTSR
jgi:hypothetical protein